MNEHSDKERKKRIIKIVFAVPVLAAGVALIYFLYKQGIAVPCIFHKITGLLCPGCGNTRAALAILRGDFAGAFSYNALFPVEFFYLGWVFVISCKNYIKNKKFSYSSPCQWVDLIILILVVIWGVVRNILQFI